jgi:hypothetical protein
VADLTGWQQVIAGVATLSIPAATGFLGEWLGRRSAREALGQARADYDALQDRWLQDRADVDRRRAEDERQLNRRWGREQSLDLLDKAVSRALTDDRRTQRIAVAQLQALSRSNLLQSDDADLVRVVLDAVVAGVGGGVDALAAAEGDDVEVVVILDEQLPATEVPA